MLCVCPLIVVDADFAKELRAVLTLAEGKFFVYIHVYVMMKRFTIAFYYFQLSSFHHHPIIP